jgi:diacylglycerol kinase (ATP)
MSLSPLYGKVGVIANPVSGGGIGHIKLRELIGIMRTKGIDFEIMVTQAPGHATELGAKVKSRDDIDALIVLGGDGTMSEVVRGLYGSEIPVATVPCGSGNDLAGTLGIPRDLPLAVDILVNAEIINIDLFKDQNEIFAETIGCGFVADVVSAVVRLSRIFHGPLSYFAGVFDTLTHFKSANYKIDIDGELWEGGASMVIINNTWRVGGGMKITPNAIINDGLLDIAILTATSKTRLLSLFSKVYSGKHVGSPYITIRRGRNFTVEADRPLIKTADGEIIGNLPMKVNIIPQAMKFFRKKG